MHFQYLSVVGVKTVGFFFNVGYLGVDGSADAVFDRRQDRILDQLTVSVCQIITILEFFVSIFFGTGAMSPDLVGITSEFCQRQCAHSFLFKMK